MTTHGFGYSAVPPPPPPLTHLILAPLVAVTSFPTAFLIQLTGIAASLSGELLSSNSPVEVRSGRLAAKLAVAASFLASPLYEWGHLAAVVLCGRALVDAGVNATVAALEPRLGRSKRWTYYTSAGLTRPLCSVLHSALLLLTWRFSHLATAHHPITCYSAWVFGALLVRSVLILANSVVMARWMEKAIYGRLETRILLAGFQIHILSRFLHDGDSGLSSILVPWRKEAAVIAEEYFCKAEDHIRYFSGHRLTTQEVAAMASCVQEVTARLPPQLAGTFGDIIGKATGVDPNDFKHILYIDKRWAKDKLGLCDEDARVLYGDLCAFANSSDQLSFHTFFTWAEEAYRENQAVGQTLRREERAIIDSDRRLMTLLFNEAFLLWLFLAGNTTVQAFAVILFLCFGKLLVDELFIMYRIVRKDRREI